MHQEQRKKQACSKSHGIGEHRIKLGREGEELAANHLKHLGWRIVQRNWRSGRYAEIDIIAIDPSGYLTFVEVKTRIMNSAAHGAGFITAGYEKIDWRKRTKLVNAAKSYLAQHNQYEGACRFAVVIVYITSHSCSLSCGFCQDSGAHGIVNKGIRLEAEIQVVQDIY